MYKVFVFPIVLFSFITAYVIALIFDLGSLGASIIYLLLYSFTVLVLFGKKKKDKDAT